MDRFPMQFGRYTLLRALGQGGMAETYLARQHGSHGVEHYVCIKTLLKRHQDNETFLRHFEREAKLISRLRHPNITQVLEFGAVGKERFLALELVDGLDLGKLHRRMQARSIALLPDLVLHIAVKMAYALECAHQAQYRGRVVPIMHRDISPSNILLGSNGDVKLSDFGIAKALDAQATILTQGLETKGKTPYMAPEYLRGEPFTPQADLYALGVTLYEILTGKRPFDAESTVRIFERASKGDYTPPGLAAPETPEVLARAIETLIAPVPELRFPSAAALLDELSALSLPVLGARRLGKLIEEYRHESEIIAQDPGPPAQRPEIEVETHTRDDHPTERSEATRMERPRRNSDGTLRNRRGIVRRFVTGPNVALVFAGVCLAVLAAALLYEGRRPVGPHAQGVAKSDMPLQVHVSPPHTTSQANASLTIMVIPAGQVIIDGKDMGVSPVTVQLKAGLHRVQAVNGMHRAEQTLQLEAGQTKRAVLRLDLLR